MADQWYYSENGQRKGPVSEEELKQLAASGQLKQTDKVWKQGMAAWMQASQVEGLIPPPDPSEPPPLEPDPCEPPPLEDAAQTASEWYYVQNGQRNGPVSKQQLRQLVSGRQLWATDLVWKQGMSQWVPLSQVISLSPHSSNMPPFLIPTQPQGASLLAYRIALVLAAVAVFLPWVQLSGSVSLAGQHFGGSVAAANGTQNTWGVLCLLCAIGGICLTFANPATILRDKVRLGMAAIGGTIAVCTAIAITSGVSVFPGGSGFNDQLGNSVLAQVHAGVGAYLAIVAGAAAAVFGYRAEWNPKQWPL